MPNKSLKKMTMDEIDREIAELEESGLGVRRLINLCDEKIRRYQLELLQAQERHIKLLKGN